MALPVGRHWWAGACGVGSWKGMGRPAVPSHQDSLDPLTPRAPACGDPGDCLGPSPIYSDATVWPEMPGCSQTQVASSFPSLYPVPRWLGWDWPNSGVCSLGRGFRSITWKAGASRSEQELPSLGPGPAHSGQPSAVGRAIPRAGMLWEARKVAPAGEPATYQALCSFILLSNPAREVASILPCK